MALSATPALRTRVPAPPSMFSDRRTGTKLVTAFVLARMSILVLSGKASMNVTCPSPDHDRVGHRCRVDRRLDVVIGAARPDVPQVDRPQEAAGSPAVPVPAQEGRQPAVRRAGSAPTMQATSPTLVVAGLIGLLGVVGAATLLVDSITAPVRRAVRVLHAPAEGSLDHRVVETPSATALLARVETAAVVPCRPEPAATTSVLPEIGRVVQEAQRAFDAANASRSAGAATVPAPPAMTSAATMRYAAARGRALGPTTAQWHAVDVDRLLGAVAGACETTVCGSLVRMSTEQAWPVAARDVCPVCATVAH
jgi:hypothetical protein